MVKICLASASPRRRGLIGRILPGKVEFISPDADELHTKEHSPEKLAILNSFLKMKAARRAVKSGLIIAADTVVFENNHPLGKPVTVKRAASMLRKISGKEIEVVSGVCVDMAGRTICGVETTEVKIRSLTNREISDYVSTGEPLDKAGAFAIQGKGSSIVEWIEGDYFNVVGMPLDVLSSILKKFGVKTRA